MDRIDTAAYHSRISLILQELGIPASYGADRTLRIYPECSDLVETPGFNRVEKLSREGFRRWEDLRDAAAADGIELLLISGFRSVDRQLEIIRGKLFRGLALADILSVNAAPGYSQHHTGMAMDLGTVQYPELSTEFETTDAFRWLASRGKEHGFFLPFDRSNAHRLIYEPWHWALREIDV